ncbi:hypothetical protein POX_h09843 [Penicillium oxalicum]|uniref:hypothetical protein n=1 Tax=Penicillium oxalicum TaxID=69781 RepID=UPI0020B660AD|nr:hypothetical protein POX_h09843 [Penicillium oxalicum]KAI2786076.1 hypothetical protein POX_h09843 [Penicillium oxalicum]
MMARTRISLLRRFLDRVRPLKESAPSHHPNLHGLPWIAYPISETEDGPRWCRLSDATPIELFFDLFFVANLSTFTATHQINNLSVLRSYIGFLSVIWFTWLQVTFFDVRFARDCVFERLCKAFQLAVMVGFASAGSRFSTTVKEENLWAFRSLTLILSASRALLALQYTAAVILLRLRVKSAARGITYTACVFWSTSIFYTLMYFGFSRSMSVRSRLWSVWLVLFGLELFMVAGFSLLYPDLGFQKTHLNTRMALLTLIIIGEGVIAVTRIENKTVRPGGWTKWSFVHILGVTSNVYLIWQAYFDISPRRRLRPWRQQVWVQLHFPFHVALILLLEGSQILALTLDVTLKLKYLSETLLFVCEEPRPSTVKAVSLIRSTIDDMEIPFSRGATQELTAISTLLESLTSRPLCPSRETYDYEHTTDLFNYLTGNVTAALFSSMELLPSKSIDMGRVTNQKLLEMYVKLLDFVYIYYFVVASLCLGLFAAFQMLVRRQGTPVYRMISTAVRLLFAALLGGLVSLATYFPLAYSFMTSPIILYAFGIMLLWGRLPPRKKFSVLEADWLQCFYLTDSWTIFSLGIMHLTDGIREALTSLRDRPRRRRRGRRPTATSPSKAHFK